MAPLAPPACALAVLLEVMAGSVVAMLGWRGAWSSGVALYSKLRAGLLQVCLRVPVSLKLLQCCATVRCSGQVSNSFGLTRLAKHLPSLSRCPGVLGIVCLPAGGQSIAPITPAQAAKKATSCCPLLRHEAGNPTCRSGGAVYLLAMEMALLLAAAPFIRTYCRPLAAVGRWSFASFAARRGLSCSAWPVSSCWWPGCQGLLKPCADFVGCARRSNDPDPLGYADVIQWPHRDKNGTARGRPGGQASGLSLQDCALGCNSVVFFSLASWSGSSEGASMPRTCFICRTTFQQLLISNMFSAKYPSKEELESAVWCLVALQCRLKF